MKTHQIKGMFFLQTFFDGPQLVRSIAKHKETKEGLLGLPSENGEFHQGLCQIEGPWLDSIIIRMTNYPDYIVFFFNEP